VTDAELERALLQHFLDARLRHLQQVDRVLLEPVERQRHRTEHETGCGPRRPRRTAQPLVQSAPVEHPDHLAHQAVGTRNRAAFRQFLQHDRPDPGQPELAREHQAVRAGPGNDDFGIHDILHRHD
jgi:hypothetical protein